MPAATVGDRHALAGGETGPPRWGLRPFLRIPLDAKIGGMPASARRRVLVVSPSETRRTGWSEVVDDGRTDVATCPGPNDGCILLRGESCPLVAGSDVALYDFDATTPAFLATLLRSHRAAEVVLVRDRLVRGRHRPSVVLRRRPRGTAHGPAL